MNKVTIDDRELVEYISEKEIDAAIERVAKEINKEYEHDIPIIIFVLNGSVIFGSDLMKQLTIPCKMTCIRLSSYDGTRSTQSVRSIIGLNEKLEGQRVLVIEDIIDTGTTYEHIVHMMEQEKVKDVKIATLTYKPDSYKKPYPIDFVGLEIQNKFIVGRGMDYNGLGRNLKEIYQVI